MCSNGKCPKKAECYRFTAKPSDFVQAYTLFIPEEDSEGDFECSKKIENKNI